MSEMNAHLSALSDISPSDRYLITQVARRFYLDDVSKVMIAKEFDLSRFKVARLLEMARQTGIVSITLHEEGLLDPTLAKRLKEHLQLQECVVIQSHGTDSEVRQQVGGAAAQHLTEVLGPGDVLGLAWGRTLTAMTSQLRELPPVSVVQLTGAVGSDPQESPVEVVRIVSQRTGGNARGIFAPLLLDDAATASSLRRQPDVAAALALFPQVTMAVIAVGSWSPPISQLREIMSPADRDKFTTLGVQAEIAGILLDQYGNIIDDGFADRCLSITAAQLRATPRVLAVAAGAEKSCAVLSAARSGLLSSLVTDSALAQEILTMPFNAEGPSAK